MMAEMITADIPTKAEAPPLQPSGARQVSDDDVIHWLNEHLAMYARENRSLRETVAARDRQIEIYRKLIADFERQKGDGK